MRRLTAIVIATNACNLRCSYCYHADYGYSNEYLDISRFKHFLEIVFRSGVQELSIVWHGGEPLILPKEYYKKVLEAERNYAGRMRIENEMQTNGTLLTPEYCDFLVENNFRMSFSYDGNSHLKNRGSADATLRSMDLVRKRTGSVNAIKVVTKQEVRNLIAIYLHFSKLGINLKLLPVYPCRKVDCDLLVDPDQYADGLFELIEYIALEPKQAILVDPLEEYRSMISGGPFRQCTHAGCLYSFICLYPNGDLFPCARLAGLVPSAANVCNLNSIDEYYHSDVFTEVVEKAIKRRIACRDRCDLYEYCLGGCQFEFETSEQTGIGYSFDCRVLRRLMHRILSK